MTAVQLPGSRVRPKVVVKIVGGLGNQMFCYAAGRRLARFSEADLVLDIDFFRSDVRYERQYRLDRFALAPHQVRSTLRVLPRPLDLRWWRVKRKLAQLGLVRGVTPFIERNPKHFYQELLLRPVEGTVLLDGYWQDERYFEDIRRDLVVELLPKVPADARNAALAEQLVRTDSVAIHCRRHHHRLADGSVHRASGRTGLEIRYYQRAVEQLMDTVRPAHLYLFGDEPRWLAENLPDSLPRTIVDWNAAPGGEVLDYWLMTRCRHFVISNSTLSWWGAWVGGGEGKRVIAPRPQDLEYWVPGARGWEEIAW